MFVGSGRVSYSNPVRKSLFGTDDCKEGKKFKAKAATKALRAIAGPDVRTEGVVLTIPMHGHNFGGGRSGGRDETEAVLEDVDRLNLLVYTRAMLSSSSWTRGRVECCPRVMAHTTETPLINAALGLDSWLGIRHGPLLSWLSSRTTANDEVMDRVVQRGRPRAKVDSLF